MLKILKKIIPKAVFEFFQPAYHYGLSLIGALRYRFPSKKLIVIGITGTKGKTTTSELVNAILEVAGYKTALQSTLRFKIGDKDKRNMFKMSMPGRFFMQKFLREAVDAKCTHAVLEITSEGAKQFRHKFIYPDALIFTNLAPEHIESHGSYENYLKAKLSIAKELKNRGKSFSSESPRVALTGSTRLSSQNFSLGFKKNYPVIIANIDDKEGEKFLALNIKNKVPYSLHDAIAVKADEKGSSFQVGKMIIHSKLPGIFNVSNILGAIAYAKFVGISEEKIKKGLENINFVRGRMEKIVCGQKFDVVVDYAHTPDSLKAIYETYKKYHLICVLGNTGGGRDTWKRPEMGKIAGDYCDQIILTNEDPYDEDPKKIIEDVKKGITNKPVEIIMDRREAINKAIRLASLAQAGQNRVAVLITGKGTDPYIMGPNGTKQEWDDAMVAREELNKMLKNET
ncbi:MAG: UDP-N-acetylmuramyl-tripeptide synthetase [Patescibacteria group bacterium]